MVLQDRTVDFPITGGLNDGADEFGPGETPLLDDATDCIFLKDGRVERRKGALAASAAAGAYANSVFERKGRVFTWAEGGFTSRPDAAGAQGVALNLTAPRPCEVTQDALIRSSADVFDPDVAVYGGYLCIVYANGPAMPSATYFAASSVYARIVDEATGAVLLDVTLATNATNPRVVCLGTRFLVTAITGAAAIGAWTFDASNPGGTWSAPFAVSAVAFTNYDLCVSQTPAVTGSAYIAAYDAAAVHVIRIDGATLAVTTTGANALLSVTAIGICHVPLLDLVTVATFRDLVANQIQLHQVTASTLAGWAASGSTQATDYTNAFAIPVTLCDYRIAIEQADFSAGNPDKLIVAWSWACMRSIAGVPVVAVVGPIRTRVTQSCLASSGGVFSASVATSPGYELVSKPFLLAPASSAGVVAFVMKWSTGDASPTAAGTTPIWCARGAALLVTREGAQTPARHVPTARLFTDGCATYGLLNGTSALKSGSKPLRVTSLVRSSVVSDQVIVASEVTIRNPLGGNSAGHPLDVNDTGIDIARVSLRSAAKPLRWVQAADSVHVNGGMHVSCDGVRGGENSVHEPPTRIAMLPGVGTGGAWWPLGTENRNVIAGWVFWDADGREHRSGLSAPQTTGVNAIGTTLSIAVSPPPCTGAAKMTLRLWATGDTVAGADPNAYMLCFESDTLIDVSSGVGWFQVSPSGPEVAYTETPYTSGGVLESLAPPALRDLCAWQDVLVGISAEDRNLLWYTKPIEPGIAPEWNPALTIRLPSEGGDVVSLSAVDDKLVCLKERAVYYVVGSTRDRLGQGQDPVAVRVSSDVGCLGRHTVAVVPDGLLFVANNGRGLCLLDRGMSVHRMRQAEDRFATAALLIHSTMVVPFETCVRWGCTDGTAIVLDYEHGMFSRFTSYKGTQHHACIGNRVITLTAPGVVTREALSSEAPATHAPYWSVTTTWIKLGGLAGFQRVRRVFLTATLGEYGSKSAVGLIARLWMDYDATTEIGMARWLPAAWDTLRHQVQWHLPRQKCVSMRLQVSEAVVDPPPASAIYTGVTLSMLSLRCGVKWGHNKNMTAAARSPGAT